MITLVRITVLQIVLFLAGLLAFRASAAETLSLDSVPRKVIESMEASKARLAEFYKRMKLDADFLKTPPDSVKLVRTTAFQEKTYWITAVGKYGFDILSDGRIIEFTNERAYNAAGVLQYDTATTPTWEKDRVVKVAREFIEALLGALPKNTGEPQVQFNNQFTNGKYSVGKWSVDFSRIDPASNIRFETSEDVMVRIFEKEGPSTVHAWMPARFSGVDFTPLKEAEALPEAMAVSKKMAQWGPVRGMFQGGILADTPAKSYLMIVRPNHWGKPEVRGIHGTRDLNARLAWVFWFPWYLKDQTPDPAKAPRALAVWIDAQNKEWIGGDAGGY